MIQAGSSSEGMGSVWLYRMAQAKINFNMVSAVQTRLSYFSAVDELKLMQ